MGSQQSEQSGGSERIAAAADAAAADAAVTAADAGAADAGAASTYLAQHRPLGTAGDAPVGHHPPANGLGTDDPHASAVLPSGGANLADARARCSNRASELYCYFQTW